jgi:hypothetical protein
MQTNQLKKLSLATLLAVFLFVIFAGTLVSVQSAKAQGESGPEAMARSQLIRRQQTISEKIAKFFKVAAINIAVQSASYIMRRVAFDTAVWLASGGKGQTPFSHTKDFSSYLTDVANNAAGVAIDELGKPFGLNLCKIPDPKIDLAMRIGLTYKWMDLTQNPGFPKPKCTWSSFQKDVLSADNWRSQFGSTDDIAKKFNVAFSVEQSDVGILMSATQKIDNLVAQKVEGQKLQRQEGQGSKPKVDPISGRIVTPASVIANDTKNASPSEQQKKTEQTFFSVLSTGLEGSVHGALSLFANTLLSKMVDNYRTKGMFPFGICIGSSGGADCKDTLADVLSSFEGQTTGGRQAAETLFADMLTPPNIQVDQYNILANFTSCPTDSRGPENCVADAGLAQAAQETSVGKPVTVADALAKNWLHGEWKLISPERSADQTDPNCHQRAYCYANIVKLRKSRILPLGFEIAVANSNPDTPWTLKQVVDGFNDCNFIKDVNGKVVGVNNDPVNKPFCHLIDPNWVLKAPESRCNFVAYGATPFFGGTPNRAQECADLSTCVAFDKNGNCANHGYCTKERNLWRIDAAKCDSQYRTCRSFQDSTGKVVSYLYRTLDTGYCTQDNVGCANYSLKQDDSGNWISYAKNDISIGENSAIYFNNKIPTNCSANSDGCSSFQVASTSDKLFLRQAPYYLGCYDTNTGTLAINWPQTASDINRLTQNPKCDNYSAPCIADEVNCNWYTPSSYTGDSIPGKFTPATIVENQIVWNDQCDKRCVGYAAYREMPSNYSDGQALAYIIPASGATCNAVDEGCASFTNLSATVGGLEKTEHYSYLRPCILPDETQQKNFYTYEGSVVGGYQLKGFILQKDTDGSPKYFYTTSQDVTDYNAVCSEALYKQGLASPDCRQFNDDQGTVYYKLLAKTIAVSGSCTPYRLNDTELRPTTLSQAQCTTQKGFWDTSTSKCSVCFKGGEFRDGQCFYSGLPDGVQNTAGSSNSCAAEVNTCRAYKGNAGNNVKNIFSNNFEGVAVDVLVGWGPAANINQSLESTHAGEHSLSYNGTTALTKNLIINFDRSYDLTFWAKGSAGASVTVSLANNTTVVLGTISVGDVWQFYHLGPAELGGNTTTAQLKFAINGQLFLDNVSLKEVADYIYLVKNTLKVDQLCDSNLTDNLPGEALGCAEYKTPENKPIYLTKFTALCREKAIGCTALYDTRKTPDESGPRAYNVWLDGVAGTSVTKNISGQDYNCQVPVGQSGCYINVVGANTGEITAGGGVIVTSTIYIQPDTSSTAPIYLVASQSATCNSVDLGCVSAGRLVSTPAGQTYENVFIKNDPALYNTALCQNEAVGCNAYSSPNGASYFKDPAITGQKICAFRNSVYIGGVNYNGWFWKGVGKCSVSSNFCSVDGDCGATGGTCAGVDEQPCYPTYLQSGNSYGLWSYGVSSSYGNFVGECPAAQNGCTEYIDHNENNKVYDLINDERVKALQSACNGQISEKAGCVLFDQTDLPNKLWNTAASFAASVAANNVLVTPLAGTSAAPSDANLILKVDRDRECGEWLQCRSSHRVFDTQTGNYKEVCDSIGSCNKSPVSAEKGDITNCANWISQQDRGVQILTEDVYRSRNTDWTGMDFSGYSILNYYAVEDLSEVNFGGTGTSSQWRLAKKVPCGGVASCLSVNNTADFACKPNANGQACGRGNSGICVNGICASNPNGSTADVANQSIAQSCRAYPEETSPFPNTDAIGRSASYSGAGLCNESIGFTADKLRAMGCDCDYTKVTYGGELTKYWNFNEPNVNGLPKTDTAVATGIVSGFCSGGNNEGRVCSKDNDCENGSCQKLGKEARLIGWHGYCIEKDLSRPLNAEPDNFACLTWFPVDTIMGVPDINSQHVEAGFQASSAGGKYYCVSAKGNQQKASDGTYSYDQFVDRMSVVHDTDSSDREMRTTSLFNFNIYQDEIDYIKIKNIFPNDGGDWFPNGVVTVYIRNGLITKYDGPQWTVVGKEFPAPQLLANETKTMPIGRYLMSDGTNEDAWYMRYDDGESGQDDPDAQFGDPSSSDIISEVGFRDLLAVGQVTDNKPACADIDVVKRDWFQDCTEKHDDADDGCAIKVSFDPTTKRLDKINYVCHTGQGSDDESVTFDVYVGLREPCDYIAQTEPVPYTAAGWTDHLWQNSKTPYVGFGPDFSYPGIYLSALTAYPKGYVYAMLNQPFGSLGLNSLDPTSPVNIFTHYDKTTFDPPPAITGLPYSCGGFSIPAKLCLDNSAANPRITNYADFRAANDLPIQALKDGKRALSAIFAKIDKLWQWSPTLHKYRIISTVVENIANFNSNTYNLTENSNYTDRSRAPQIHPFGACKPGGKCLELSNDGITLNGKLAGDIVFSASVAPVNLKFFGFADKNQMPIRKMQVDWGDGDKVALDGYFRNQRGAINGVCGGTGSANTCFVSSTLGNFDTKKSCVSNNDCRYLDNCFPENMAPNFGQISDKTCDSAYFRFDHVYQCLREGMGWRGNAGANQCPDQQTKVLYGGCCVFQPKIQVRDNWGWCNGTCTGGVGGNGCYEKDWGNGQNKECSTDAGAWTPFAGQVIVAPQ